MARSSESTVRQLRARRGWLALVGWAGFAAAGLTAPGQEVAATELVATVDVAPPHAAAAVSLPTPETHVPLHSDFGQGFQPSVAGRYDKYIEPQQQVQPLTFGDKFVLGFRDAFSPTSIAVWPLVAGYEQLTSSAPDWPRNTAGYFRRAGAAAVRDSSDGIFSDSIFSPLFHQDPRYYRMGRRHGFVYRTFYAVTRPLVTLTDGGRRAVNVSEITGTVFGSWLTDVYYPTKDQNFGQTAKTFGGSMGSTALGCFFAEFADDLLAVLHLRQAR